MTIKVTSPGYAKGVVESADMPSVAGVDVYKPWAFRVHNVGEDGIFGGAIVHASGPGSIFVKWDTDETEMLPDPDRAYIIYYGDPQPNCTRLSTSGQIKFMAVGTYVIQVHGVHQEGTDWISDDYQEFTVEVTEEVPPEEFASLKGKVTGFLGRPVGGAVVKLNSTEKITDSNGAFLFLELPLGSYALKVAGGLWYNPVERALKLTEAKLYTENVGLGLKTYIMLGVPLACVVGVGGGVAVMKRVQAPAAEVYRAPPGYELIPKAPLGYRLVRE